MYFIVLSRFWPIASVKLHLGTKSIARLGTSFLKDGYFLLYLPTFQYLSLYVYYQKNIHGTKITSMAKGEEGTKCTMEAIPKSHSKKPKNQKETCTPDSLNPATSVYDALPHCPDNQKHPLQVQLDSIHDEHPAHTTRCLITSDHSYTAWTKQSAILNSEKALLGGFKSQFYWRLL